ncbi:MAG TPA: GAF domain-containing protein [Dehalococcoidia bacterium]
MSREVLTLVVHVAIPVAATAAWWLAALARRLRREPALGHLRDQLPTVHAALLAPAAVAGALYGLHAAGIPRPWEQVVAAPAAWVVWWSSYVFVAMQLFSGAGEEGRMARRLRLAERRVDLYQEISSVTEAPLKPRAALYVMLEYLMKEFGMQVGMVHLANERGELSLVTYRNIDSLAAGVLGYVQSGDGWLGQVHSTATPAQVTGRQDIGPGGREVRLGQGIEHVVAVPLRANGATLGVLTVGREGRDRLAEDDVESLRMVAAQIGGFVEGRGLAQRNMVEQDIAFTRGFVDPHEFVRVMETEMGRARRYERPLTIASIVVAGYDESGDLEAAGRAIRTIADLIRRNLRMADYCAYHDKGRFSLLLPETDAEGCRAVGRRVAQRLSESEDLLGLHLSVQLAHASYPNDADTVDELLQALQEAAPEPLLGGQAPDHLAVTGAWPEPPAGWRHDQAHGEHAPASAFSPQAADDPAEGAAAWGAAESPWAAERGGQEELPWAAPQEPGEPAAPWAAGQEEPAAPSWEAQEARHEDEPPSWSAAAEPEEPAAPSWAAPAGREPWGPPPGQDGMLGPAWSRPPSPDGGAEDSSADSILAGLWRRPPGGPAPAEPGGPDAPEQPSPPWEAPPDPARGWLAPGEQDAGPGEAEEPSPPAAPPWAYPSGAPRPAPEEPLTEREERSA